MFYADIAIQGFVSLLVACKSLGGLGVWVLGVCGTESERRKEKSRRAKRENFNERIFKCIEACFACGFSYIFATLVVIDLRSEMDLDIATAELESFSATPIKSVDFNISDLSIFEISENTGVRPLSDPVYEQFLADVWVGIVLTLMVLSCVCFMCSCLIYHKFQEWKNGDECDLTENLSPLTIDASISSRLRQFQAVTGCRLDVRWIKFRRTALSLDIVLIWTSYSLKGAGQ
ncbi:hypothetical protein HUJ05_003624 [Dendroctonus ponderosae]|nr:hypothetical protein HUJ05_003624 [Dendroctonus ponderosae]